MCTENPKADTYLTPKQLEAKAEKKQAAVLDNVNTCREKARQADPEGDRLHVNDFRREYVKNNPKVPELADRRTREKAQTCPQGS